jgi:thiamine-phosphate pyrophosphorylase
VVHVGQQDLPCRVVRELVGPGMVVGESVGSVAEAREAERQGADYVSVSPVFLTPTKPDADQAVGLEGIRAIRDAVRVPVVAIGGLNAGNAGAVIGAGADGVCVVSAIMSAADPEAAARQLLQVIEQARRGKDEAVRDR